MREEDLRDQLGAWIRPVRELPVPDVAVIRRRLRRRRAQAAATAAAVLVTLTASGLYVRSAVTSSPEATRPAVTSPHPPGSRASHCGVSDLRVRWYAHSDDTMPGTVYKLMLRNTAAAPCTMDGYPLMTIVSPRQLRSVTIGYNPDSAAWPAISPRRITLTPGAAAEVNVLAGRADTSVKCSRPTWAITLPGGQKSFSPPPSPGSPTVCANSNVEISPVHAKKAQSR